MRLSVCSQALLRYYIALCWVCVCVCFCVDSNNIQQIEYFIFIQHSSILCDRAIAFLLHRQMQTNEIALALMLVC